MPEGLRALLEALRDLLPILLVIACFYLFVFERPLSELAPLARGIVWVLAGLALFVRGLEVGLFPLGERVGLMLAAQASFSVLMLFAFLLGFATTIAEPALIAIARKAAELAAATRPEWASEAMKAQIAWEIRVVVALSVGAAVALGCARIVFGWPLPWLIVGGYVLVELITPLAPKAIIGIAYDAGGVTTSTITVPLVAALGVGLARSIEGRNPVLDGFGIIALASLTPMIFVLAYGFVRW